MTGRPPEGHERVVASVANSEPLAPGILLWGGTWLEQGALLGGFWHSLSEELLPRCLWRLWAWWWGQVHGRRLSGWDQQTHGWWCRHGRVTISFQLVSRGHRGATSMRSVPEDRDWLRSGEESRAFLR